MLSDIGINEQLANNLFVDLELNKGELEKMIKQNMDQKIESMLSNADHEQEKKNINSSKVNSNRLNEEAATIPYKILQATNNNLNDINEANLTNPSVDQKRNQSYNLSLSRYVELRSHFDVIRKLGYLPNLNSLVSISEDCLIKVWSLNNINFSNQVSELEPYLVLRGHTGPLFSLAIAPDNSNLIYTAGNEGIVKIWKIPKAEELSQYGDTDTVFNCNVGFFQKPNEVVWDLKHHPRSNLLISLCADASIYIWETATADEYVQALTEMKYDNWFKTSKSRNTHDSNNAIPTTSCFNNTDYNSLICGFNDATLSVYDFNKNAFHSNIKTFKSERSDKSMNMMDYQPNCLVSSSSVPIIYGGFEDSSIKTIDMRIESVTNTTTGHNEAVTSLNLFNDIYLFSTSHDTKIKMWDIRYLNAPITEAIGSQKKWDEAMWHSILIPNSLMLATDHCIEMQKSIEKGIIDVDDIYIRIVKSMMIFLEKMKELSIKINEPINYKLCKEFYELNELCNEFEDRNIITKLYPELETQSSSLNNSPYNDENKSPRLIIEGDSGKRSACCGCQIY